MKIQSGTGYKLYKGLAERIEMDASSKREQAQVYKTLVTLFRLIEHSNSSRAWAQRADLLDGIDALHLKDTTTFPRLKPLSIPDTSPLTAPLVRYQHLQEAAQKLQNLNDRSLETIQTQLGALVENEPNANAKLIDNSTKPGSRLMPFVTKLTGRLVTSFLSQKYRATRGNRLKRISKFSVSMHIGASETVNGHYWGPRALFGRTIHQFKSVNDWFCRNLTDQARREFVSKEGIIANSDCRLRISTIPPWQLNRRQRIAGKALSQSVAQKEARYLTDQFPFTAKNLFGRENCDTMLPSTEKIKGIRAAQHELLAAMYRLLDSQPVHQVVQRLSPSDVHHYVAPTDGLPLSHLKAAKLIKQLRPVESEHMDKLIQIFRQQERHLGRPSAITIDFRGTLNSVAAQAIDNRPAILGQNDRKVMLFQHEDQSFSIHIFIGAIGVNQVNVDPQEIKRVKGERLGDMQFGREKKRHDKVRKLKRGERKGAFPMNGSTVISYYPANDYKLIQPLEDFRQVATYDGKYGPTGIEVRCQMGDQILRRVC